MKKHLFLLAGLLAGVMIALKCKNHSCCKALPFLDQYKKFVTHISQVVIKDYKKMDRKQMSEFLTSQVELLLDAIYPDDEEDKEATDAIL